MSKIPVGPTNRLPVRADRPDRTLDLLTAENQGYAHYDRKTKGSWGKKTTQTDEVFT